MTTSKWESVNDIHACINPVQAWFHRGRFESERDGTSPKFLLQIERQILVHARYLLPWGVWSARRRQRRSEPTHDDHLGPNQTQFSVPGFQEVKLPGAWLNSIRIKLQHKQTYHVYVSFAKPSGSPNRRWSKPCAQIQPQFQELLLPPQSNSPKYQNLQK